ncbi:MAG: cytochrome c biogenesis protein ResB [Planctomycetes bacterium]|nr:cytochrome c biogenesis protein ResB [Planctomycetota bacterium]
MPRPLSACLLALACALPAAETLPANGAFEEGKARWWGEGGWSVEADPTGGAALRIAGGYACQDKMAVQGGTRYQVRLRIRCEGAEEGSVFVQASFRGKGVDPGWRGPIEAGGEPALVATGGSHAWKEFSVVVEAPAGADQFLLYLRKAPGSPGTAWYDDVAIAPTEAPATPAGGGGGRPVVKNPGFEKGKAGWWGEGAWSVEAGQGVDGSAALKLDKGFACQDKIAVTGRQAYRISMRIRSEGCADASVYVQTSYRGPAVDAGWRGPALVKLGGRSEPALFVTGGSHGWQEFSTVVAAPPGAQQILVYLRKQDGAGSAWFDQVAVAPSDEKPLTAADVRRAELATELLPAKAADPAPALAAAVAAAQGQAAPLALAAGGKALAHLHVASDADVVALGAAAVGLGNTVRARLWLVEGAPGSALAHRLGDQAAVALPFAVRLLDFQLETWEPTVVIGHPDGAGGWRYEAGRLPLETGRRERLGAWTVEVLAVLPQAAVDGAAARPFTQPGAGPAATVAVRDAAGALVGSGWVHAPTAWGGALTVPLGGDAVALMAPPKPRLYRSLVAIDHGDGRSETATIEVNRPLVVDGWWLYQTGYDQQHGGASQRSELEAVHDPALPGIYAGCALLFAGLLLWLWRLRRELEAAR